MYIEPLESVNEGWSPNKRLSFHGDGQQYFGIWIVNLLLMVVTLGLYYPWAKAASLRYFYQETELAGSRFQFHGTGKEMFRGFIRAIVMFGAVYGFAGYLINGTGNLKLILVGFLLTLLGNFILIPFAIHGSVKYRASRTSWRGIHFGYRGDRMELFMVCLKGGLLTLFTMGIYFPWLIVDVRRYVLGHLRFGNVEFEFVGRGSEYFGLRILGVLLIFMTWGIYYFWYQKSVFDFYVKNILATQDGEPLNLSSTTSGGGFARLLIPNFFISIFIVGIPWASVRLLRFVFDNVHIEGNFDANRIQQTEADYRDATGDDMADMLDVGIV